MAVRSCKPLVFYMLLAGLALLSSHASAPNDRAHDTKLNSQDVVNHLNATIAWYERVNSADQETKDSQNILLQDSVQTSSRQVVQKAFAFARAAAPLAAPTEPNANSSASGQSRTLEQSAAIANDRIQRLQSQINDLNQQIQKAPRRKLAILTAQRDTLQADLSFAKLTQSGLKDLLQFANAPGQNQGLLGQIDLLANSDSIPAALSDNAPQTKQTQSTANSPVFHPESAGIVLLVANSFQLMRSRSRIDSLATETDKLNMQSQTLLAPLGSQLRSLISRGDTLASETTNQIDPNQLASTRQQINRLSGQFKTLSAPIFPLIEQRIALQSTRVSLEQWRDAVSRQMQGVLGYVFVRLISFAAALILLLIVSRIVHKATLRYVRDARRRRQFVLIRRFVVGVLAAFMAVLASVSGIGSFATVAGLLTAGLAVALQNVILSLVAYFFLIGRFGLRTGDRVTVTGLTGQVIEVGLIRFYLMELAGTGTDVHSTGRVAVFSNSVIFQPAALIKQAPGTEYTWHSISVTLTPETNFEEARERISKAVSSVYHGYQSAIESQHKAFERAANIQVTAPNIVSRARFSDAGVEVIVRFPVELQQMSEIDEKVIEAVIKTAQTDPQLNIAPAGYPKVSPVA